MARFFHRVRFSYRNIKATARTALLCAVALVFGILGLLLSGPFLGDLLLGDLAAQEVAQDATKDKKFVDLELVLAVDASSSVSPEEFDLQIMGLANAFREPSVLEAIRSSGDFGIAVALVQWSDNRKQVLAVDWTPVRDANSAEAFAEEIESTPRFLDGGGTAIGGALQFSAREIEKNDFDSRRKVIDVSGDGRANQGSYPGKIRDLAVAKGITINGLAILNEDFTVDGYYLYHVIGGTGAFVMTATDYQDFAAAMLEKLIKEIAGVPIVRRPAPDGAQVAQKVGQGAGLLGWAWASPL